MTQKNGTGTYTEPTTGTYTCGKTNETLKEIPSTKEKIGVPITVFDYDLRNYKIIGILKGKFSVIDGEFIVGRQGTVEGKDKFTRVVIQEKI